jgi:hypothetical protein
LKRVEVESPTFTQSFRKKQILPKMKSLIQFLFFLMLAHVMDAQSISTDSWIQEEKAGFTLTHPKEWRFDDSGDMGALFTIYSPYTDEDDHYNDYVQLNKLPVYGLNMTLSKHLESVIKDIPFFYQKSEVTLNRTDNKSGQPCAVLAYHGLFNDFALSHYQYIWLIEEQVYTLSFSGQPAGVELLLPEAIRIMDSLILKK